MSKIKRCKICGRALTTDEIMMSLEACTDCIKRNTEVPKTGSNVKPAPVSPLRVEFANPTDIKMQHIEDTETQRKITDILNGMNCLLLYKNQQYGDSAINPKKVFYKGDSTNSILIRLDDKLGRVMSNPDDKPRVNDVADIIGYCTLLLISMGVTAEDLKKFMD